MRAGIKPISEPAKLAMKRRWLSWHAPTTKAPPPTIEQFDKVSQLERTADWLRVEMDAQILTVFT